MNRWIKIALFAVVLVFGAFLVFIIVSQNEGSSGPTPSRQDQVQAAQEWANMDPLAREISCEIYIANEEIISGDSGLDQAKRDLLEGTCVDE